MAGGKGTRISEISQGLPKPMISVCGKPVIEHQIDCLKRQGFTDFIISVGYLKDIIKNYFGDGSRFGINIEYCLEEKPMGSGGALTILREILREDFILINGDIIFDVDINRLLRFHKNNRSLITLTAHPNNHPHDSALIVSDLSGQVTDWIDKNREKGVYHNSVNAGIHVFSHEVLKCFSDVQYLDLDVDIIRPFIKSGKVYAYTTPEYIHDMGTPVRYFQVCKDYDSGIIAAKNLLRPQKAVFLDRDGTLNIYKGFISNPENIELIPGAAEAVKILNILGYIVIVVTNQPVIARGECSWEGLKKIHNTLETLLGEHGAYVNAIYVCPHHPDSGFSGEVKQYKIECNCRKPKPGLLLKAAEDFNINMSSSWMIGDSENDIKAGKAACCRSILIGKEGKYKDLLSFVNSEIKNHDNN